MPIVTPAELKERLSIGQRLLGIDLGTKTIGLALSDSLQMVASPLLTLSRGKFSADAEALGRLRREHGFAALILGLPLNMVG